MVTKKQVEEVLKKYPDLHYYGFGFRMYEPMTIQERDKLKREKLKELQQHFFNSLKEIEHVVNLLQHIKKIKTINERHSSYGLKHWAEKTAPGRYISNGSFIVGAILTGFETIIDGPNAWFNISEKSFKEVSKEGITMSPSVQ